MPGGCLVSKSARLPECRRAFQWCPECQARSHLHPSTPRWLHCCGWGIKSDSCTLSRDYGAFCRGESKQAPYKPTRMSATLSRSLDRLSQFCRYICREELEDRLQAFFGPPHLRRPAPPAARHASSLSFSSPQSGPTAGHVGEADCTSFPALPSLRSRTKAGQGVETGTQTRTHLPGTPPTQRTHLLSTPPTRGLTCRVLNLPEYSPAEYST